MYKRVSVSVCMTVGLFCKDSCFVCLKIITCLIEWCVCVLKPVGLLSFLYMLQTIICGLRWFFLI